MSRARKENKNDSDRSQNQKEFLSGSGKKPPISPQLLLSSTFTVNPILQGLDFWREKTAQNYHTRILDYNQVFQALLQADSLLRSNRNGLNVILIRFEDWLFKDGDYSLKQSLHQVPEKQFKSLKQELNQIRDDFVIALQEYSRVSLSATLLLICPGCNQYQQQPHWQACFHELYESLEQQVHNMKLMTVLRAEDYHAAYHVQQIEDPLRDQEGHIPFTDEYYDFLSTLICRFYFSLLHPQYKVLVIDCDHTLWNGVCGEQNPHELDIKGMTAEFQKFLIRQKEQGMLLCLCSKNIAQDVENVFNQRPDFPLKQEHLTDSRINWQPKSSNIRDLAQKLNLGLDSFIFIDDNPVECAEVRENCPQVLTIRWPQQEEARKKLLQHTWVFDHFLVTEEDAKRTVMMRQNIKRQELLEESRHFIDFLEKLHLAITIKTIESQNISRVSQLTQRTNQFNFTTTRRNENEIREMITQEEYTCQIVNVEDRFGKYGLVGVLIYQQKADTLSIDSFILSCRVLGRGVEHQMMAEIGRIALQNRIARVTVLFKETEKNKPAQIFLDQIAQQIPARINKIDQGKQYQFEAKSLSTLKFKPPVSKKQSTATARSKTVNQDQKGISPVLQNTIQAITLLTSASQISQAVKAMKKPWQKNKKYTVNPRQSTELNLRQYMKYFLAQELNINSHQISLTQNFKDYGMDSILVMDFIRGIEKHFQVKVRGQDILKYATIESLTGYLKKRLNEKSETVDLALDSNARLMGLLSHCPLSEVQKGFWVLQKQAPGMSAYNIPLCFRIKGEINLQLFEQALQFLLAQHPILGCIIEEDNGLPYLTNNQHISLTISQTDISKLSAAEILPFIIDRKNMPFSLTKSPLIRVELFSQSPGEAILLITVHHIILDGSSQSLLIETLFNAYQALEQGQQPQLIPLSATYHDFVQWEKELLTNEEGRVNQAYWKEQLSGTLPILDIPADHQRPPLPGFEGKVYTVLLTPHLSQRIRAFARKNQVNLSVVFLAWFQILLHRYTGQEDIIVGLPSRVRPNENWEQLIGLFINMIPIRSQIEGNKKLSQLIQEVQKTLVHALDHNGYPFPQIVRDLNVPRSLNRTPVYQTVFAYQNFTQPSQLQKTSDQDQKTVAFEFIEEIHQEGEYEYGLEIIEQKKGFVLNMKYNPHLYDLSTIKQMMAHYKKLISEGIKAPDTGIGHYPLLSSKEEDKILSHWNLTGADYPKESCLHQLFEEQAQKNPHARAVFFEGQSLTYQQLNEKSHLLALYLQKKGIGPDCLVGVCVERCLDLLVALLGILKAGGAYLPLDPHYPVERLAYMVEDSQTALILTHHRLKEKVKQIKTDQTEIFYLDIEWEQLVQQEPHQILSLKREVKSSHLVYVIYTSGSTGKPKGVMIGHQGLINLLYSMRNKPGFNARDILLSLAPYGFDMVVPELFLPLVFGAKLHLCPADTTRDAHKLKQKISQVCPTIMQMTPSTCQMLFSAGWVNEERVKILCGAEAIPLALKKMFEQHDCEVWNMYGPTEATVWSTTWHLTQQESISIGKPLANTQIYILDPFNQPTPVKVPGELCIAGDAIARGYLNQSQLSAEKFIDNHFNPGTKLYKSGDLARYLTDGKIEFLGRMDFQVKVRGFRIELGEIEAQLSQHPGIRECAIILNEQLDTKRLVAYYVLKEAASVTGRQLNTFLQVKLPDYMIPTFFIPLDQMPLTANGKVDRLSLMKQKIEITRNKQARLPQSETEQRVLKIWQETLGINDLSTEDGFFDVGGDSILAVIVSQRIKEELQCHFNETLLFKFSNIKGISHYIVEQKGEKACLKSACLPELAVQVLQSDVSPDSIRDHKDHLSDEHESSMAIIGISCQFPGAQNHNQFWQNLCEGKESIRFFSEQELRSFGLPEEIIQEPNYIPAQSTIDGKDQFDPGFFNISARDALWMDPQARLLLMHAWKAVEDAGYRPAMIPSTSVFMSASNSYYQEFIQAFASSQANIMGNPDQFVAWVLAQGGTIPTLISYKLGLKGASYFVHSNCSSSLVGLHSAFQSLQSKEAKYALVGASTIFFSAHPGYLHHPGLNFSSDGHIKAFDAQADGMIGGEGAAVILLKRAPDAIREGDHIYALLRGVGLNNDGADKVGFYAPSVKGQTEVIDNVLKKTKINPLTIGYIEAHGTGTKLGDPIEFAALNEVYQKYTTQEKFCGLGSVKTNIGHMDTAAGLAGCIKVALSLYYSQIPPTLNYEQPNPNIDLQHSPFYIVDCLKNWEKNAFPHRAALNSLGVGGTNGHAIFEEYVTDKAFYEPENDKNKGVPYIIPLSAKNHDRLKVYAKEILTYLNDFAMQELNLSQLAYTLQVGRQAMENRLAIIIASLDDLKQSLTDFINDKKNESALYLQGEVKQFKDLIRFFENDDDHQQLIKNWILKGKMKEIAGLWVKGLSFNWDQLYDHALPKRISLPTYPFAKESYWIKQKQTLAMDHASKTNTYPAVIHPLLHQNTSTLLKQRFSSTFTGKESFLCDHVINGQKILPGMAYLEMARAALWAGLDHPIDTTVLDKDEQNQLMLHLKDVVWSHPIVVEDKPLPVYIHLLPGPNGDISFEIYSLPQEKTDIPAHDKTPLVHSQGIACLDQINTSTNLDIQTVQSQCNLHILTGDQIYQTFQAMGFIYGQTHRCIKEVFVGKEQVLAQLALPVCLNAAKNHYVLHPGLLDSALQASIVLAQAQNNQPLEPAMPFALQELELFGPCLSSMWALIQPGEPGTSHQKNRVRKVDITLYNEQGQICVRMRGFSSICLEKGSHNESLPDSQATLLFRPVWQKQMFVKDAVPDYDQHVIFLCELSQSLNQEIKSAIKSMLPKSICIGLVSDQQEIESRYQQYSLHIFEEIQRLLNDKQSGQILMQIVVSNQAQKQIFSALLALLKAARLENSRLTGQLLEVDEHEDGKSLIQKLNDHCHNGGEIQVRYQEGIAYRLTWKEIEPLAQKTALPWKNDAVYLITGGTGQLGLIFAREIARSTENVTLVLTGKKPLNTEKQKQIEELKKNTVQVLFRQVDIAKQEEVFALMKDLKNDYGQIKGIIHSAGIIQDNFIMNKTFQEMKEVLAPKVNGLVFIDQASQEMKLDFLICFSSLAGVLGGVGQPDYAAANSFMDAYVQYRNHLVDTKKRFGKTLSINWPLWAAGGMQVNPEVKEMLLQNLGITAMKTEAGINAFYESLAAAGQQIMVMTGPVERIRQTVARLSAPLQALQPQNNAKLSSTSNTRIIERQSIAQNTTAKQKETFKIEPEFLKERVLQYLKKELSDVLKLSANKITEKEAFEKYGIDSIMIIQLTNKLEKSFGTLSKTLFFEYQNLEELSGYFLDHYKEQLIKRLGLESEDKVVEDSKPGLPQLRRTNYAMFEQRPIQALSSKSLQTSALDIAIIGLSGKYPRANNIEEYWINLKNGQDCIQEIPKVRWDWQDYYTADRTKAGYHYSKYGGFINDVDRFDPLFFNITPREAVLMDPQERILIEQVWLALEDAGYTRQSLQEESLEDQSGQVGVYAGVMYSEYQLYGLESTLNGKRMGFASSLASIANRVSYFLNIHGPSMALDTMCSSSLTAIHLACQDLKHGKTDMAIAGGVNVSIHPNKYFMLSMGQFISSQGHCESFGIGGDGYIPGEGVGVVILKRLSQAIQDRDNIYGVIKGSAINHGGKTNGYSVPNPKAQANVIRLALDEAHIKARTISYVEAHGTGTSLGDPIEIAGLTEAFAKEGQDKQFCYIGSAKSNIGHCEGAAGIAGLTKILLQLKYKQIVPSLHSEQLNPNIDFNNCPFIVNQKLRDWQRPKIKEEQVEREYPRLAGLSSFGAGGSNAHLIVEEYHCQEEQMSFTFSSQRPAIIVLSAKTELALNSRVRDLRRVLEQEEFSDDHLLSIAYTLQTGRENMAERLAFTASSIKEVKEKLNSFLEKGRQEQELYTGNIKSNKDMLQLFNTDLDLQQAVNTWLDKGKYWKLLDVWTKGMAIDWNKLYPNQKPFKISLPGYAFARERYWIDIDASLPAVKKSGHKQLILEKKWREMQIINPSFEHKGIVFIIATEATLPLARQLFVKNKDITVAIAVHGENQPDQVIKCDYYSVKSGYLLYEQFKKRQGERRFLGLIDLTALDIAYESSMLLERGKIALLQKLVESEKSSYSKILQVTYQLSHFNIGHSTLQGARTIGLYRMLGAEYKMFDTLTMDCDHALNDPHLLQVIESEFKNRSLGHFVECVYRDQIRYQPYLSNMLDRNTDPLKGKNYTSSDVILVTGGCGGIGAALIAHIMSQGVKKVVIMGRQALPAVSQWKGILDKKRDPVLCQKLNTLQAFLDQGLKLLYFNTPLTDPEALKQMCEQVSEKLGKISGVFHCAGLASTNPVFFKKKTEEIEAVCLPKIQGLVTLHKTLQKEACLQFMVLFSSIAAIVPTLAIGQSDYAMANSFMDYYASSYSTEHCPIQSLQWPAWSEIGMAAAADLGNVPQYRRTGLDTIMTEQGLSLLDQALSLNCFVCAPIVVGNDFKSEEILKKEIPDLKANLQVTHKKVKQAADLKTTPATLPDKAQTVSAWLKEVFKQELQLSEEQFDVDKSFEEYGLDSILFAELTQILQKRIQASIAPSLLFEYHSVRELTDYLIKNHQEAFDWPLVQESPDHKPLADQKSVYQEEKMQLAHDSYALTDDCIAVVGISCRFPGAPSKEAYWDLLSGGKRAIQPVPESRWTQTRRVDYGGWINDIEMFDADFFQINPNDAAIMDPKARVILEESLRAIYDAGYNHKQLSASKTGIYVGGRSSPVYHLKAILQSNNPILGIGQNYLATNISRFFNFTGPSLVIDTACSSGLVALSIAADHLKSGRIDLAMAGSVDLILSSFNHELFSARNILSKRGEFHIFDKKSDGEVLGEGAGMLVLKRLSDAVRDGNRIYGVVKGIAINNDGRTLGPGSPNIAAQKQVISHALQQSNVSFKDIGYIEVNGGGSPIVDLVEIKALAELYALNNLSLKNCALGSVKPNIGHLLLSSGLAGFIRCLLSLSHQKIPPFLSATDVSEHFDFASSRILFNRETIDWLVEPAKKRIAVQNSFPDGGTNCHVILEEFTDEPAYQQVYFPRELPKMTKKYFPLPDRPTDEMIFPDHDPISISELKNKFKKQELLEEIVPIENIWGKFNV